MIAIDDLHKSYRTADGRLSAVLKGLSLQVPGALHHRGGGAERRR